MVSGVRLRLARRLQLLRPLNGHDAQAVGHFQGPESKVFELNLFLAGEGVGFLASGEELANTLAIDP
jgi:hypothetical protein